MSFHSVTSILQSGGISDPGSRGQFNVLLWTSLVYRILGLPSRTQAA